MVNNDKIKQGQKTKTQQQQQQQKLIGLQAATVETRKKVAREGGLSPHATRGIGAIKDPELRSRIARLGGLANKQKHGRDYYSANGRKGGNAVFRKFGRKFYRRNGLKGVAARKKRAIQGEKKAKSGSQERSIIIIIIKALWVLPSFKSVVGNPLVYDNKRQ